MAIDIQAGQQPASCLLPPARLPLKRDWAAQTKQPVADYGKKELESQRHSAPDPPQRHCVRGARNRWRAAAETVFRSSNVRKSMVPNSRSQAGGAAIRAPIARYVFRSLGILIEFCG